MAGEILTRCGYRCDLCLAYRENVEKEDRRSLLSDGWQKYFGFRIEPEDIVCDGCLSRGCIRHRLLDEGCPVRPCVIDRSLENCSQCSDFPCSRLKERIVDYDTLKAEFGKIPPIERKLFLRAYENGKRLAELKGGSGEYPRMTNAVLVPDAAGMAGFIGGECSGLWTGLLEQIRANYKASESTIYGGRNYGWAVQFKQNKSKTLFTLYPERNAFSVLIVYGRLELDQVEKNRGRLSVGTCELLDSTPQLHDGKWVLYRVKKQPDINDLHILMDCKKAPSR